MGDKIVSLVSPHHDPSGNLLAPQNSATKKLKEIFDTVNVSLSHQSDGRVNRDLEHSGVHVSIREETGDVGERYRSALHLGLEDKVDYLLLVDFDRAIHWVNNFEDELRMVVEDLKTSEGVTNYVRSEKAFETHPLSQRETERVVNDIASEVIGRRVDIVSGAWGLDHISAKFLIKEINKSDFGYYGQILAAAIKADLKINTVEVDGLEWETPDQFKDQINRIGYTQWLNNFQSLEEWEKRLTLAFEAGQAVRAV